MIDQLWAFKNAYELLQLRALKMSMLYKNHILQYKVSYFLWNLPFEIPHKISLPLSEICVFHLEVKIKELLNSRAHTYFWNTSGAPLLTD